MGRGRGLLRRIFGRGGTDRPQSPDGMVCVASTREPEREKLPKSHDRIAPVPLKSRRVQYRCGHDDCAEFKLDVYGEVIELNDQFWKDRPWCSSCYADKIRSSSRRCALCGLAIHPGDGVALYAYTRQFSKKPWVCRVGPEGESVLGCLRWDCCPSGGFFAGHWDGEKFVGAFDGRSMAEAVMRDGCSRVVTDTRQDGEDKK